MDLWIEIYREIMDEVRPITLPQIIQKQTLAVC